MGKLNLQKGSKSPSTGKTKSATTKIVSNLMVENNYDFSNALISVIIY